MQLRTRPARPFSTTHTVKGCCGEIATLNVNAFRDGGELTFAHERYRIRRAESRSFVLEGPEGVLASARGPGSRRCFEIAYSGRCLTVEPVSNHAYVVTEGVARRGVLRRRTPSFVRGIEAELTAELPLAVQLFIAWLMLVPENRLM